MTVLYRRLNRAQKLFARFGYHPQDWEVFDPNTLADSSIASYKQSSDPVDENVKYLRDKMLDEGEIARNFNVNNCLVQADKDWAKRFAEGVHHRHGRRWEQWRGGRRYDPEPLRAKRGGGRGGGRDGGGGGGRGGAGRGEARQEGQETTTTTTTTTTMATGEAREEKRAAEVPQQGEKPANEGESWGSWFFWNVYLPLSNCGVLP